MNDVDVVIVDEEGIDVALADTAVITQGPDPEWGNIGGDITDQLDLQSALDTKYDASNPDQFISAAEAPVQSVAGKTGAVILNNGDVGLGNVDNTTDLNKPISTATQTALDAKQEVIAPGDIAQYYRGDKTWQTLDNAAVGLPNVPNVNATLRANHTGTQLASTISDFSSTSRSLLSGTTNQINYNSSTGVFSLPQNFDTGAFVQLGSATLTRVGTTPTTAPLRIIPSSGADGNILVYLGTDRPWSFKQRSTGALASLSLETDQSDKRFLLGYNDGTTVNTPLAVNVSTTTANNWVEISQLGSNLIPKSNNVWNIGSSGSYFANTFSQRLTLNSTAFIDGANAGRMGFTLTESTTTDTAGISVTATRNVEYSTGAWIGLTLRALATAGAPASTNSWLIGGKFNAVTNSTDEAAHTSVRGGWFVGEHGGKGTIAELVGGQFTTYVTNTGGATNSMGLKIDDISKSGTGAIANQYGIYINSQTKATNSYAIYTNTGRVRFGDSVGILSDSPTHSLSLGNTATGIALYNTADQITNYERLLVDVNGNTYRIRHEAGGTGTVRDILIGNTKTIRIMNGQSSSGSFQFSAGLSVANAVGTVFSGTLNAASGTNSVVSISPSYNQTGTAGSTDLLINRTQTALGSGAHNFIDLQVAGSSLVRFSNAGSMIFNSGFSISQAGTVTMPNGQSIVAGTGAGLKIGTSATQKIGFFNATPVAQPTGVSVDAASIHAALVSLGLITA